MEEYSGVYEKGASGARVVVAAGPLMVGADAVAVVSSAAQSSYLRRWLWATSVFIMEVIFY